jgi:1,4-alpha-glucan branching enzyme
MIKKNKGKAPNSTKVTFVIPHNPDQARVSVVGDFNDWDPNALKLVKRSNGTRSASTELANGDSYRFRYYTADGEWFNDGDADDYSMGDAGAEDCLINL